MCRKSAGGKDDHETAGKEGSVGKGRGRGRVREGGGGFVAKGDRGIQEYVQGSGERVVAIVIPPASTESRIVYVCASYAPVAAVTGGRPAIAPHGRRVTSTHIPCKPTTVQYSPKQVKELLFRRRDILASEKL